LTGQPEPRIERTHVIVACAVDARPFRANIDVSLQPKQKLVSLHALGFGSVM
jgi:hypothetical protein